MDVQPKEPVTALVRFLFTTMQKALLLHCYQCPGTPPKHVPNSFIIALRPQPRKRLQLGVLVLGRKARGQRTHAIELQVEIKV